MTAEMSPSQKTRKRATGRHTGAYARYIRQLVVDGKIVAEMYVLSFINPLLPGVADREQHELCCTKFEITRKAEG